MQEYYTTKAQEIIDAHDTSIPLFLYMAMPQIHTPLQAPDDQSAKYKGFVRKYGITQNRKTVLGEEKKS